MAWLHGHRITLATVVALDSSDPPCFPPFQEATKKSSTRTHFFTTLSRDRHLVSGNLRVDASVLDIDPSRPLLHEEHMSAHFCGD